MLSPYSTNSLWRVAYIRQRLWQSNQKKLFLNKTWYILDVEHECKPKMLKEQNFVIFSLINNPFIDLNYCFTPGRVKIHHNFLEVQWR